MVKKFKVNNNIIPFDIENNIINDLSDDKSYGPHDKEQIEILRDKFKISSKIIISLRSQYLKNKALKRHYLVKKNMNQIQKLYLNTNILDISKKFDLTPLTIMRNIIQLKYKNKINKLNLNKLSEYDKNQLELAINNDIIVPLDQTNTIEKSIKFEKKIEKILNKRNIEFQTQEELVEIQKKKFGKAIITPDFLLNEKIMINKQEVNWIEVKNFYGSNISIFKKKINKQTEKYYNKWGPGCLIFRHGFTSNIKFEKTLILAF